jgi:hypothetical protein
MHNDDEPGEGATRERKGDLITALLGQSMVKPKGSVGFGLNYFVQSQVYFHEQTSNMFRRRHCQWINSIWKFLFSGCITSSTHLPPEHPDVEAAGSFAKSPVMLNGQLEITYSPCSMNDRTRRQIP